MGTEISWEPCDRCNAMARVTVTLLTATLVLCRHHYETHEIALIADGWMITRDTRSELAK